MSINTNKKKIKLRYVLYIIFLILFGSILFFSSDIVSLIISNSVRRVDLDLPGLKKDSVYYNFDTIEFYNDFSNNVYFAGWAFCETSQENDNKQIWFIFESDKATYIYKNEVASSNLYETLKSTYNIQGNKHRFYSTASTVIMKNGIYKVYIYCKENENNYGLVDTGVYFEKNSKGIRSYKWESEPVKVSSVIENSRFRCSIDSISITPDKCMEINGWSFIEGLDTTNQRVYIRLTSKEGYNVVYNTQTVSRPDVGTAYKDDIYSNSGFKFILSEDKIPDGNLYIEVLIENDRKVYQASQKYIYSKGKLAEKGNDEVLIDFSGIKADSRLKYHIDSCIVDKTLTITGWGFITDKEASETSIYLAMLKSDGTTNIFETSKQSRPDVADVYKNRIYTESGFKAVLPLDIVEEGVNTIAIIAQNDELLISEKPYTFSYTLEGN